MGFRGESVAQLFTRIWQDFPLILILVSPSLLKGINGATSDISGALTSVDPGESLRALLVLRGVHIGTLPWGYLSGY